MLARIVKYTGLILIILFSVMNVFISINSSEFYSSEFTATPTIKDKIFNNLVVFSTYFENRFYDFRMNQSLSKNVKNKKIVLVAIDDISINKIGVWPLPRENYANLIDKLNTFGAKVIAFDVFFSEMSTSCKVDSEKDLPEYKMVQSIKRFNNKLDLTGKPIGNSVIIPYSLSYGPNGNTFEEMPDSLFDYMLNSESVKNSNLFKMYVSKDVFPIPMLLNSSAQISHILAQPDSDGVFRNYQLVSNVDELYLPSIGLSAYEKYTGYKTSLKIFPLNANMSLKSGANINVNIKGQTKVRWSGGEEHYKKVSLIKLLNSKDDDLKYHSIFKDTIVYVGSTAFGANDLRQTPIGSITPGVYSHMALTDMLLNSVIYKPVSDSMNISWLMLLAGCLIILGVQFFGHPILDLFTMVSLSLGFYFYDTYYLIPDGYDTKLFFTLFAIVSCYSWNTFLHFYMANKDKAFLKKAFGSYISPELIDEMYKSGDAPSLGGESGIRTAYFTDIQGFSSFSEKLSATELVDLLNEYLSVMTDILLEESGTLDKYEGDAIIAFFGAPMPLEDHATRACLVAHKMQEALLKLREKWASEGDKWPSVVHEMRMRIGINTGEIVTGNMGSATRMNYTMMGDSVNLAARLEEAAKQYGIFTQVSKATKDEAGDMFVWRELDTVKVVGKSQPVTTFELLSIKNSSNDLLNELAEKFNRALVHYKSQNWDKAMELFTETVELEYSRFPKLKGVKTNPSEIYIKRCQEYKNTPPGNDWDGVYTLTSK